MVSRHYGPGYGALSGDGARRYGGRWNPPESYGVVYMASSVAGVDAEFGRLLATARLPVALPRELATLRIDLKRVLDLRLTSVRDALDISVEDITGDDLAVPRAIGEAAQRLGYEAIVAPSATGIGHVVAIMLTNLAPDSSIEVLETRPYDPGMPTT